MQRIGIGTDRHRLMGGRKLVLAGLWIDFPKGLAGHSDGDVVTHAVIDALLGAAGLGDIGHHFPDSDAKWKDASSIEMLKKVVVILKTAGYHPVNVDVSVHLEQPKLARLKQEMAGLLADALSIPRHMVNVKAKTGEGLGEVGRGEVIDAFAVALVESLATP
jgi:2-C-methyl-D-erythritol 2,4-cyclodiphosphate synthase